MRKAAYLISVLFCVVTNNTGLLYGQTTTVIKPPVNRPVTDSLFEKKTYNSILLDNIETKTNPTFTRKSQSAYTLDESIPQPWNTYEMIYGIGKDVWQYQSHTITKRKLYKRLAQRFGGETGKFLFGAAGKVGGKSAGSFLGSLAGSPFGPGVAAIGAKIGGIGGEFFGEEIGGRIGYKIASEAALYLTNRHYNDIDQKLRQQVLSDLMNEGFTHIINR